MNKVSKKLYRSEEDKIIFGVCGGLSEYFEVDPVIVRIVFLLLLFTSNGVGLVLYLMLALILPSKAESKKEDILGEAEKRIQSLAGEVRSNKSFSDAGSIIGIVIILIGTSLLFKQLFPNQMPLIDWRTLTPLLIIAFGLGLIIQQNGKK